MQLPERLRSETQTSHHRLHQLIDANRLTSDLGSYKDGLSRYLSVVEPAETSLASLVEQFSLEEQLPPHWHERLQKASWLREDLACLNGLQQNVESAQRDQMAGYGEAETMDEALALIAGRCYALEGMTLGATRMASLVRDRLDLAPQSGCRFFVGYGPETSNYWKAYRAWCEAINVDHETAVKGAHEVFRAFELSFSGDAAALESAGTDV